MKQKHYIAGLYYRLSQEDERQGESVSIDNQRTILRKYAEERGFEIHDEYIDDGISGTTFQRPEVQRLLDDAKTGVINTIIVKDLSRFGRNYIEVGQRTVCGLCIPCVRYSLYCHTGQRGHGEPRQRRNGDDAYHERL